MNTCKITFRFIITALVLAGMVVGSASFAKEPKKDKSGDALFKTGAYQPERYQLLNINNLWSWHREDGQANHSPTGDNGTFFPRGTAFLIYQDGMVFGSSAYVDAEKTTPAPFGQKIRVGGATYDTGQRAGWITGFGATAQAVDPDDPRARVYRIRRDWKDAFVGETGAFTEAARRDAAESNESPLSDVTDSQVQQIMDEYQWSWDNWPVDLGAPYIDRNDNGVYDAPPSSFTVSDLIAQQYDEPGIAGADPDSPADQVLFTIFNDLNRPASTGRFGSEPTGLEIQMTMWGYKRTDALGNIFFRKWRFINKGGVDIDEAGTKGVFHLDSMYVCQWSDPDLGSFSDDLVGCDTLRSIGFVYNGNAVDTDFRKFNLPPPSGGYDFLQGPAVPDPGGSGIFNLQPRADIKNLGMTGFSYFSAGSPYSDPGGGYATNTILWYKMLRGYAPLEGPDVRYAHPPGTIAGEFPLAGDPVAKVGHIDGDGEDWSFVPGDRRLLVITGPFTMAPGDTQEVVVGFVAGLGADRLSSISVMKFNDRFAQNTYDALFQVPSSPAAPAVTVAQLDGEAILEWGSNLPRLTDTENKVNEPGGFVFEGYNVYQLPTATSTLADAKRIVTFDKINETTVVLDEQFDVESGQILEKAVQFGTNSDIKRLFHFDRDYVKDVDKINNGTEYYLAVTAYSISTVEDFLPASLESEVTVLTVSSQVPFGRIYGQALGDTVGHTHSAGSSDGAAYPIVVNPTALNGHQYRVTFTDVDSNGVTEWGLEDMTENKVLLSGQENQSGDDNYVFTDGFQLRVVGAPLDFKNFQTVANASGPLDPPEGAAADFQGFPSLRPTDRQQVGAGLWMFHTGDNGTRGSYSAFLGRSMRGSNFSFAIPYDWEMRFTGSYDNPEVNGSYAVRAFEDGVVVWVPFELWCIGVGTPDDPSDDFRVIPWILEAGSTPEVYDYTGDDHSASGGDNDPFTDWIYWRIPEEHLDYSPGTAGYDNYIAALDFTVTPATEGSYGYGGAEVIARSVLMNWNGGSAAPYNQDLPEQGTIFRLITTKPNTVGDQFTFTTPLPETGPEIDKASAENVGVFPNPYYAFNPLETNRLSRFVTFNNLPSNARIRIFNLAGHLVRSIAHEGGQFRRWNLLNHNGLPVASGMYIAYIEMPDVGVSKVLKLAVVQEGEILETF